MNEILQKLEVVIEMQQELKAMVYTLDARLVPPPDPLPENVEVWLTKAAVMELLFITKSTFFRRRNEENWTKKKIGKSWYYLKSSVLNS